MGIFLSDIAYAHVSVAENKIYVYSINTERFPVEIDVFKAAKSDPYDRLEEAVQRLDFVSSILSFM